MVITNVNSTTGVHPQNTLLRDWRGMKGIVHYELLDAITADVIVIRMPNNRVQYWKPLVRTSENFICMNDGI